MSVFARLMVFCVALSVVACDIAEIRLKYDITVRNAHTDLPLAGAFATLYPTATESISYFIGSAGSPSWHSEVGIHDRYILTMWFPITLSGSRTHSSQAGPAQFLIAEVGSVEEMSTDQFQVLYSDKPQKLFGLLEWNALEKSKGDLSALGIEVIKDKPIKNFEKALRAKD